MIYDVLDTLDTLIRDAGAGINAQIAAVNTAKGTSAPTMGEISTWEYEHPTEIQSFPGFLQYWAAGGDWALLSQGKWRGDHRLTWLVWEKVGRSTDTQKHVTLWAHAVRSLIDTLPGNGTIEEIRDVTVEVTGPREPGSQYVLLAVSFTVKERDENP